MGVRCAESDVPLFQLAVRPAGGAPAPAPATAAPGPRSFVRFVFLPHPGPPLVAGPIGTFSPPVRVTRLAVHRVLDSVPQAGTWEWEASPCRRGIFLFPPRHRAGGEQHPGAPSFAATGGRTAIDNDVRTEAGGEKKSCARRGTRSTRGDWWSEWWVKNFGA